MIGSMKYQRRLMWICGIIASGAASTAAVAADITGVVTGVTDGGAFSIGHQSIRIFGIDAPALRQQCRLDAIYAPGPSPCIPCGEAARHFLAELILGKDVVCTDRGTSNDRMVGECTVGKIQIGPYMLSSGQAVVDKEILKAGDRAAYIGAEASAKRAAEGLWSMTFIPPVAWRDHQQRLECER